MPSPDVPLSTLALGTEATISRVDGEARDPVARRLADLGFLAGTRVTALRRAPTGDPTIYELRNYQMCLRRREADRVLVRAAV
ncbi:MAG: FeoA family protein [Candidatus Nanopelagicales bacterium]|nr:FeoA family protein [Candidatus Nanopelagicales bacterium]